MKNPHNLTQLPAQHNYARLTQLLIAQQCALRNNYHEFAIPMFATTVDGYIAADTEWLNNHFPDCEPMPERHN